jgi:Helicase associated domain
MWTRSVRHNYRHQIVEIQQRTAKQGGQQSIGIATQFTYEDGEGLMGGAGAATEVLVAADDRRSAAGTDAASRPRLSDDRLRQLRELDFVWDAQRHAWEAKYRQLVEFQKRYGHCRVPNNSLEYPRLGVWVRNQRRERKKLMMFQEQHHHDNVASHEWSSANADPGAVKSSTLTPERLRRLEALGFDWYKSHDDTWNDKYRQLQQYAAVFGHANVKQDDPQYFALGQWCMNQRIAYRKRQRRRREVREEEGDGTTEDGLLDGADTDSDDGLTLTRIQRLERVGFSWHVRDDAWQAVKHKLVDFYEEHGHVEIPTTLVESKTAALLGELESRTTEVRNLELLRTWLNRQRHEYKRLKEGLPSPMTLERIRALETSIPNFSWQVRGLHSGPSTEDWAKLFDAMRAKGLTPGMRPKSHWFEGAHPFKLSGSAALAATKDVWTEQDLLALWNQESEEEEDADADLGLDGDAPPVT